MNRCLSEGRRRFADRLAGIESGAECDRLAPQLSALADGEARAEDMAALRTHLRTCLICRARLRDYRAAPARVAAFAPPVAAAGGLLASARDLLHAVAGWLGERSAAAVRWHQAAELAATHKVAAIAASTAMLAGGGAATVATVDGGDRRVAIEQTPANSPSPRPPASGNETAEPRETPVSADIAAGQPTPRDEAARKTRDSQSAARSADTSSATAPAAGEFTPDSAVAGPVATKPDRPSRAASSEPAGGGEFGP